MNAHVVIKRMTLQQIENMIRKSSESVDNGAINKKKKTSSPKTQNKGNGQVKSVRRKKNVISKAKSKVIPKKAKSKKPNPRPQFILPFKARS